MRHFDFPPDVMNEIERDRFNHVDPLVQRRMEVLWLKAHHQTHEMIATLAGVSRSTVQRLLDAYEIGGLAAARTFHWKVIFPTKIWRAQVLFQFCLASKASGLR